jgi:hypothetical protein
VSIESIANIEKTAQTVDIDPTPNPHAIWGHPLVIGLVVWSGLSFIALLAMIIMLLK